MVLEKKVLKFCKCIFTLHIHQEIINLKLTSYFSELKKGSNKYMTEINITLVPRGVHLSFGY